MTRHVLLLGVLPCIVAAFSARPGHAAVIAMDEALDPAYADGWQNGDDGGFGLRPWKLANFYEPTLAARPEAQFIATNSFVDIPSGGPAWGQGTDNRPFFNSTAIALRHFDRSLRVGDTLSIDLDNPVLQPLIEFDVPGLVFRLVDPNGEEKLGLLGQLNTNNGNWNVRDASIPPGAGDGIDTGLAIADTSVGGFNYAVTITGPDTYDLTLTPYGSGSPFQVSGTFKGPGLPVEGFWLMSYGNGSATDGSREFYANNLRIVPEPSSAGLLVALLGGIWCRRRPGTRESA